MVKLMVIGYLGRDAVVKEISDNSVINFSVCSTEKFSKDGEQVEKQTWVDCSKWGEKTAVAEYMKKGTQVYVEGSSVEIRTFEKADGSKGHSLSLRVNSIQLLGNSNKDKEEQPTVEHSKANPAESGNLPF